MLLKIAEQYHLSFSKARWLLPRALAVNIWKTIGGAVHCERWAQGWQPQPKRKD
jgi:hypothetical protein